MDLWLKRNKLIIISKLLTQKIFFYSTCEEEDSNLDISIDDICFNQLNYVFFLLYNIEGYERESYSLIKSQHVAFLFCGPWFAPLMSNIYYILLPWKKKALMCVGPILLYNHFYLYYLKRILCVEWKKSLRPENKILEWNKAKKSLVNGFLSKIFAFNHLFLWRTVPNLLTFSLLAFQKIHYVSSFCYLLLVYAIATFHFFFPFFLYQWEKIFIKSLRFIFHNIHYFIIWLSTKDMSMSYKFIFIFGLH